MPQSLELGLIVGLSDGVEASFAKVADLGLTTCQLCSWDVSILSPDLAEKVRAASASTGIRVSSYWAGHSGRTVWNFIDGPTTIGLVPPATRAARLEELKRGADFAAMIAAPSITTHVGFITENPNDPEYAALVDTLRDLAQHCGRHGLGFWFETGQETPVTLLRAIEDIGTDNLGINLDPANLVLYGKANPVDALDVFGACVRGVHAKDGLYPVNGRELGQEVPLGEGKVDFPALIARLRAMGFDGALTIEREIEGDQQIVDIRRAIEVLEPLRDL
ncbi:MAG: xylose isomerase [Phycisphaeraceae bacterium]|nr:xylose isomerase [Phycisphaeraceae bacterium]